MMRPKKHIHIVYCIYTLFFYFVCFLLLRAIGLLLNYQFREVIYTINQCVLQLTMTYSRSRNTWYKYKFIPLISAYCSWWFIYLPKEIQLRLKIQSNVKLTKLSWLTWKLNKLLSNQSLSFKKNKILSKFKRLCAGNRLPYFFPNNESFSTRFLFRGILEQNLKVTSQNV